MTDKYTLIEPAVSFLVANTATYLHSVCSRKGNGSTDMLLQKSKIVFLSGGVRLLGRSC